MARATWPTDDLAALARAGSAVLAGSALLAGSVRWPDELNPAAERV
jgi:hypothetical protein